MFGSGSVEPEASNVTVAPETTVCAVPADATGARLTADTVTTTVSVAVATPFDTFNSKVYGPPTVGVNVGLAVLAPDNATVVPPLCVQT